MTTGHYYAVIFTSVLPERSTEYIAMADKMEQLARLQEGFIDIVSVRSSDGLGITVSYWESVEAIHSWKQNSEHLLAQEYGRSLWYKYYKVELCKVEKSYSHEN